MLSLRGVYCANTFWLFASLPASPPPSSALGSSHACQPATAKSRNETRPRPEGIHGDTGSFSQPFAFLTMNARTHAPSGGGRVGRLVIFRSYMRKCSKNATSRHRASARAAENSPLLLFLKKTPICVLFNNKKGYFSMRAAEVGGYTRWNSPPQALVQPRYKPAITKS